MSAAGAARKKGEVVANARRPPPPVLPAQIRQRLSEGRRGVRRRRRRRLTGTMCPSHLSLPPHPPALHNRALGLGNTGTLIQTILNNYSVRFGDAHGLHPPSFPLPSPRFRPSLNGCVASFRPTHPPHAGERGHVRNPDKLSWLCYDPETLMWDGANGSQRRQQQMCSQRHRKQAGVLLEALMERIKHLLLSRPQKMFSSLIIIPQVS